MVKNVSESQPTAADQAWKQLEDFIDSVSELAGTCTSPDEFFEGLLADSVRALGVNGAGFWLVGDGGAIELAKGVNLDPETRDRPSDEGADGSPWHQNLIAQRAASQGVSWVPRHGISSEDPHPNTSWQNPSRQNLLLQAISIDDEVVGVLEFQISSDPSPAAKESITDIAGTLADLTSHFLARFEVRRLRHLSWMLQEFSQSLGVFNGDFDLESASFAVCNEARRIVNCQRASLVITTHGRSKVLAISNIDSINRRSASVKSLESLAGEVSTDSGPIHYRGDLSGLPDESRSDVEEYVKSNEVSRFSVVPVQEKNVAMGQTLRDPPTVVFVFDWFEDAPVGDMESVAIGLITAHGGATVLQAQELTGNSVSRSFVGMARSCARSTPGKVPALLILIGVVLALLVCGWFVPSQFWIRADGNLEPVEFLNVFAPFDGKIQTIHVQHDQHVQAGAAVLQMQNDELKLRRADLAGELQETIAELDAVNAELANPQGNRFEAIGDQQTGAARLGLLNKRQERIENQLAGIDEQLAELRVNSPIDGRVVTWDVIQELSRRPVRRGQRLLSIANTAGKWNAELRVEDRDVGYVAGALQSARESDQTGAGLPVEFTLRSEPSRVIPGRLISISETTLIDSFGTEYVVGTVTVDREQIGDLRPGARLVAKIDCGYQPTTFVWFRDLIEFVQTRWFF